MQKVNLDKSTTAAIKGIALMLMFIHHFFAYPEWYVEGVSYPQLTGYVRFFRYSMKICVPVFAFLTGYFYAYAGKRSLKYSFQKITDILVSYWTVYFLILLAALAVGYRDLSLFGFLQGCLGRNIRIMTFCWYVSFYCLTMLILPLAARTRRRTLLADSILLLLVPFAVSAILENRTGSDMLRSVMEEVRLWFPCVASGFLCARYGVLDAVDAHIREKKEWIQISLYGLCVCFAISGRYWRDVLVLGRIGYTLDVLYAPAFVYGISKLLQYIRCTWIMNGFRRIGKQSMMMWFIHCIFFNVLNEYTQRILYWPKHPVLVVAFGLAICDILARIISPLARRMIRFKDRMLGNLFEGWQSGKLEDKEKAGDVIL